MPIDFSEIPIGLPWYRQEDYSAIRSMVEDPENLRPTWEEFARLMDQVGKSYKENNNPVVRVEIKPDEFRAWCSMHGRRIDTKSAHMLAAEIASREVAAQIKASLGGTGE
jgi:hypothetical protein